MRGERDDAADKLAAKGRWARARAWYEGNDTVARRNTALVDAQQLELLHERDAAGGWPPTAMEIAQAQRQARAVSRDNQLRHETVLRNNAMRRQRGTSTDHAYGMAPSDSDLDEEQLSAALVSQAAQRDVARPCSYIGE